MKPVNDIVSKEWATSAKEILTKSAPDITTIFTRLLTMTVGEKGKLKTEAARERLDTATRMLNDAVKFGWAHGINTHQARFTRPKSNKGNRRIRALLSLAVSAGETVGNAQAKKINSAHGIPKPGTFSIQHTHATSAP
jgi:hypothetical protein